MGRPPDVQPTSPLNDEELRRREGVLPGAREALGPDRARAAGQRGAARSLETAAEYVLLLTAPGPAPAQRPPAAAGLSARERELVTWSPRAAPTRTSPRSLYISIRTVRSHLDRIRDKTGARRRADLTRLALAAGLV
jgi:DNA-binding CsgD family transcriptional regulator